MDYQAPQFQQADILGSYIRGRQVAQEQQLAPLRLQAAQQGVEAGSLSLEQTRQALKASQWRQGLAQQVASGQPNPQGAQAPGGGSGGIQNGPQASNQAPADNTLDAILGRGGVDLRTSQALAISEGRDPNEAGMHALQFQQAQYKPKADMQIADYTALANDPHPATAVLNSPGYRQLWQQYAAMHNLDPANDLNDSNVRTALKFGINAEMVKSGQAPNLGFSGTLKPGESHFQNGQQDASLPNVITPYEQAQLGISRANLGISQRAQDLKEKTSGLGLMGDNSGNPAQSGLSGPQFLATLQPNIGSQVKALAEGRMPWPTGMALKTPYWQQMLTAVSQYDPSFDAVNYNARSKTRSDFTSGKSAQNIKSLNTAIGHLGTLDSQIEGTSSSSFTPYNSLANKISSLTGDSGPTQFDQTAGALASELTQVFRGSGGAEADVKRYLEELDKNGSQDQKKAAVKNIAELLKSRIEAIGDQYNQGMGTTADPLTLLNPKAASTFKRLSGDGGSASSGPVQVNSPEEAAKLAPGTVFITPDGRKKVR